MRPPRFVPACFALTALIVLCGMAPPPPGDAVKDLERAAKSGSQDKIAEALEAVQAAPPDEDAVETILKIVPMLTKREAYLAAVEALAAAAPGKAREAVAKGLTRGRALPQRVACADALGAVQDDAAVTALADGLKDREQPVRVAVIRSLSRLERRACIEPLFRRLFEIPDRSGGTEVEELFRALTHLTGQAFNTLEDWEKYHSTLAADFDPKTRRGTGEEATTRTRESEGKLFDSEVTSRSFVLVLDISSSMRVIDLPEGETWTDPQGKTHGFRDPGMGNPDEQSRFRRAQREFVQFIESLTPRTKFAIVVFGNQARLWHEELVPANDANKRAAVQFVQGLQWEPATVTDVALERAFSVPGADTIYLFSDGIPERPGPSGGNMPIPQDEVIAKAQELNLTRKLRLHCYGFATASTSTRGFLRRLAESNDGEYKDIR
jgi:hypothetical protein